VYAAARFTFGFRFADQCISRTRPGKGADYLAVQHVTGVMAFTQMAQ
jgi:hypothetical protein